VIEGLEVGRCIPRVEIVSILLNLQFTNHNVRNLGSIWITLQFI